MLASCRQLEGEGFKVTYLPVNNMGLISMEELEKAIQPDTALVTIMFVNNEIGVRQPIRQIGRLSCSFNLPIVKDSRYGQLSVINNHRYSSHG